jgi:death-on-curing protein
VRIAWLAAAVFLDLNGMQPDVTDDLAFDLVLHVAGGSADVPDIVKRLNLSTKPSTVHSRRRWPR